ncbi:sulfite exporter TauE/SafE family protein [Geitlerinema splendidum]|nr:sulfite exporter TauE/SafE family protein [Geitlerinema splendidum]
MTETPLGLSLIFVSGVGAAAINAVAGGGTLISFPTLLAMGLPDRIANATNAVALWPGSASGALGFHKYFQEAKAQIKFLLPSTIIGSILGSILLVVTPEQLFKTFVPFLILAATLLLAFQVRIKKWSMQAEFHLNPWIASLLQFFVALYGGYFGAGMGIMMLAIMSLYVEGDIHRLNAIKKLARGRHQFWCLRHPHLQRISLSLSSTRAHGRGGCRRLLLGQNQPKGSG